ncbi:MAG TPA: hypothetical protein VHM19_22935 [Polyangiales bacterium]|jgi:hypothetical protein|nr:hypothetical protein [Polyangiales bacterium]
MIGDQDAIERSQLKALEASLLAPHQPAIDRTSFRLGPWLRENAAPTAVREALEAFALDVLRKDRLLRGVGAVPETTLEPTPVHSPRAAIEPQSAAQRWPQTTGAEWPQRRGSR